MTGFGCLHIIQFSFYRNLDLLSFAIVEAVQCAFVIAYLALLTYPQLIGVLVCRF